MTTEWSSYDSVVIGSGHNGLIAAAYLAAAGQSVLILEKNAVAGGATQSQQIFPDYDALLSRYSYLVSLLPDQIVSDLKLNFRTKPRDTASFTPWRDSAGNHRGLLLSNADPQRSASSMRELTGSDSEWRQYQKFAELQATLTDVIWPSFLQPLQTRQSFLDQLRTESQKAAWDAFVERPLGESIEHYFSSDLVRGLILTDAKIGVFTWPHDPSLLQNRCFLYHISGNGTGEWKVPVGGMQSLVNTLLHQCRQSRVEIRLSSPALHIETQKNQHVVTFQNEGQQQHVTARRVLINAGPKTFCRLLDRPWQPAPEDEGSVIKINMLLKQLPQLMATGVTSREAFGGTFHIDEGYQQMLQSWRQASQGQLPDPAPGEIYCHTLTDPSILSPDLQTRGFHTLTLFGLDMPWRLFEKDHDLRKKQILQRYLEGLNRVCAEPFEECLARDQHGRPCIEIRTPQDLQQELDLDLGNIFHNQLSWFFAEDADCAGQWGVETDIAGIYRAGSSAMRGGAVSGIPGYAAARCILGLK
ncbi:MAG: NAD(P)/FAD-dependent oxidoreductase [Planctomycetia bacterium]